MFTLRVPLVALPRSFFVQLPFLRPVSRLLCTRERCAATFHTSQNHRALLKTRVLGELKTMKINGDQFKSIITPEMRFLEELFTRNGFEIRIAGGAVRDLLMGQIPHDIDFASTATPDEMKKMFTDEGIRMINAGGEKHGTITARINDKENFEVTTLRVDVVTDGRRAEVEFTKDWQVDANRRDLTVNSMFLSFDGTVFDYFKGIEHLQERKILFVGDATRRIQEDYLRILRYFRFYGRLAIDENGHDGPTLEAIRANVDGLKIISGERLWVELRKIIEGPLYCPLVCLMHELGVTRYLGFPDAPDFDEFRKVCRISDRLQPSAMTRLAALLRSEDEVLNLHARLRLSNAERNHLLFIVRNRDSTSKGQMDDDIGYYKELQFNFNIKGATAKDVWQWTEELLKYKGNEGLLQEFRAWEIPHFPINGSKLMAVGVRKGPKLGHVLTRLRQLWFKSNFMLTEAELMDKLSDVLRELSPPRKS